MHRGVLRNKFLKWLKEAPHVGGQNNFLKSTAANDPSKASSSELAKFGFITQDLNTRAASKSQLGTLNSYPMHVTHVQNSAKVSGVIFDSFLIRFYWIGLNHRNKSLSATLSFSNSVQTSRELC